MKQQTPRRAWPLVSLITATVVLIAAACAPPPSSPPSTTTTSTTTTSTTTTQPPGNAEWQDEMLASLNAHRAAHGRQPLTWCSNLATAAQAHSDDMATNQFMAHVGSDGSTPSQRANAAGYASSFVGENVAFGYASVAAVMDAWINSPGHNDNMLHSSYQHAGFGLAQSTSGARYWTQKFGANGTCG